MCWPTCKVWELGFADYQIWQWEDENSEWNPYSAHVAVKLQRGLMDKSPTVSFKVHDAEYTVSLGSKPWQQTNEETGYSRNVAQVKSGS